MSLESNNFSDYLGQVSKNLLRFASFKKEVNIDSFEKGTRIAKTDKGARTNARIEAMRKEEIFDESETPVEELKEIEVDIVNELVNREIEKIFE